MAMFVMTFDSNEKTFKVAKDGVELSNIAGASVYCRECDYIGEEDGEYCLSLQMAEKNKVDDTRTMTCIYASEDKADELSRDIASFLNRS